MNLQQILSSDLAARLGWTLLHSLWQGAAVALVLVVTMRLLRFHSPPLRYSAALGSLAVLLIAMGMTFAGSGPVRQDQSVASTTIERVEASAPSGPPSDPTVAAVSPPTSSVLPRSLPTSASRLSLFTTRLHRIVPYLACAWGLGVLLVSLWHTGGWIAVQRLRRLGVESVDAATARLAGAIATKLNIHRVVRVVQSLRIETPLVVGWLRPMILLPAAVLVGLTPGQLEAVLAHELAHIRRHDYLVNLVQVAIETLLFYHPAVWWISRRIRLEREQCCDDIAVAMCGDRCRYVESLAALEEVRMNGAMVLAARGAGGSEMVKRVRRLLAPVHESGSRYGLTVMMFVLLMIVALTTVACMQHRRPTADVTAVMTVEELLQHLVVAEQPLRNLKVAEFELTEEFRPAGTTVWKKTPYQMTGTAYFGDPASGAARLDISREIFPAQPDLLKWEETAYSIGFDGVSGREVIYKYGGMGHPTSASIASTFTDKRQVLDYRPRRWATGIEFSTNYVLNEGQQFSAAIRRVVKQGTPGIVDRVKLDGRDLIRYRFVWRNPPVHTGTLWFDPNRNYTLIAQEAIHNGEVEQSDRVTELVEAAPGVWYPIAATHEGPSESTAKGTQRYSYRAAKVVANDPAFDAKIFTVPIPTNRLVQAERNYSSQKQTDPVNPPTPPGALDNTLRVKSAKILRLFGQIIILYENEFNGLYPPDLATGVKAESAMPEVLKSPMGDEKVGYDYVYLHYKGMGRPFPVPDDAVVVYDAPDAVKNGGACVLFGDGNVRWLDAAQLKAALGKTEGERPRS